MKDELFKIYDELTFKDKKENNNKRENANINTDGSMGVMLKYGTEGSKLYTLESVLPKEFAKAHMNGDIHIHDLDFYNLTTTCCQIELDKLFQGGFNTGHGFIREPSNIQSAAALTCIAIQSNQNDQHGGQSIPAFDYYLAPYVAKSFIKNYIMVAEIKGIEIEILKRDFKEGMWSIYQKHGTLLGLEDDYFDKEISLMAKELTEKDTFQAMESLIHNLNTMHSRAGAQIPFSSINYGTDTSEEARLLMKSLLEATKAGLGNGETPIFPIQIFKVKEGVNYNKHDPNYDLFKLAIETSAKRLFPNFSFMDAPFNKEFYVEGDFNTEVAYMGCRTRVIANTDKEKQVTGGRGNLSFTSINLPRIAIESKGNMKAFYTLLDKTMGMVIRQLLHRFGIQSARKVFNYPFLMEQGVWLDSEKLGKEDTVGKVLKHGTLSVGFIGLAECLKQLTGYHHGENENVRKLGYNIVKYMREYCDRFAEIFGLNYSLLATPAEGLSGRFVALDREKYGIIEGVTDREYYTNSFHIPVYFPITAFEKIKIEAPFHELTNAGHISYVELDGDVSKNLEAFEQVIRCMKENGIGYGSINHPVDRDPVCGYTGIINDVCPGCGREQENEPFERIRRITGYLVGTMDRWNDAKTSEEADRVKHVFQKEQL